MDNSIMAWLDLTSSRNQTGKLLNYNKMKGTTIYSFVRTAVFSAEMAKRSWLGKY